MPNYFDLMHDFFFSIFQGVPAFLMSEPIIYFVSILIAIYIAGILCMLLNFRRR